MSEKGERKMLSAMIALASAIVAYVAIVVVVLTIAKRVLS